MKNTNPTHPAWGMVSLSYQEASGRDNRLFRSPSAVHSQVCLRVSRASMTVPGRGYGESRPWPEENIVEIWLTPVQFAELITQPNRGNGVPCTLATVGGERMPPPPPEVDELAAAAEYGAEHGVAESVAILADLITRVDGLISEGKGMGIKALREFAEDLGVAKARSTTDLKWWRSDLSKRAEKMRARVATDLHATADMIVRNMGLETLRERARVLPDIPEAKAKAIDVEFEP